MIGGDLLRQLVGQRKLWGRLGGFAGFAGLGDVGRANAKADLILRLEAHLLLAKPIDGSSLSIEQKTAFDNFERVQADILRLMEEADKYPIFLRSN